MIRYKFEIVSAVFFLLLLVTTPLCAEEVVNPLADISVEHRLDINYQGVSQEGNAGSASEYSTFDPGMGFGLDLKGHIGKKHLYLDANYINDRDYMAEAHVDLNGRFKINLASERLWHNLEHIPYTPGLPGARDNASAVPIVPDPSTLRVIFEDQNPGDEYGVRVEIDKAEVIAKIGNYPAHVRLKYWRLQKEGKKQLRFVEEGHDDAAIATSCNVCHVQSKTRPVDRLTEEFSGSVDAHVGFLDFNVEQLLRTFRVKDPIPVDNFAGHSYGAGTTASPDTFQHSEDPESQLLQSTVTLRTALSGGLVADGAYTYGKRENNSDLAGQPLGVDGVSAESVYQKAAGNLSYTPLSALTLNLRYRMLDIDTKNSDTISAAYYRAVPTSGPAYPALGPNPPIKFPVRENMDTNRYEYSATAAWRPAQQLTVKGDFQRETIVRGSTGEAIRYSGANAPTARTGSIDPVWELPEEENIDQYRLSLTLRPLKTSALRINTWYRYMTSDEPAYGTSFDDKHEAFLGFNYSSKTLWGLTATARALQEKNEDHAETVWISNGGVYSPYDEISDRDREQQNYDFGVWVNPWEKVTTGLNYGYMRTYIEQDLLFGATDTITTNTTFDNVQDKDVEYLQNSQNLSAFVNVQWLKSLSTRVEGYYVRSLAKYSPNFSTTLGAAAPFYPANSDNLSSISRLDVIQQGLNAGIDWNPAEHWTVGLTYTLDDYDARNSDIYDGTTQSCMVSLARSW